MEEIEKGISDHKNNKCPGEDEILNELINVEKLVLTGQLKMLFNKILTTSQITEEWKKSQIVLLHMKGDRTNVNNYMPISLTCIYQFLFAKLIKQRSKRNLEEYRAE